MWMQCNRKTPRGVFMLLTTIHLMIANGSSSNGCSEAITTDDWQSKLCTANLGYPAILNVGLTNDGRLHWRHNTIMQEFRKWAIPFYEGTNL